MRIQNLWITAFMFSVLIYLIADTIEGSKYGERLDEIEHKLQSLEYEVGVFSKMTLDDSVKIIALYKYQGIIHVEPKFMYLKCSPSLAKYYRFLARDEVILIAQRIDSHISVIRTEELSPEAILPKTHHGEIVEFFGNPEYIQNNLSHYWFRIISPRLEEIRISLGFSYQPVELKNNKLIAHPFHFTIGRIKEQL